MSTVLAFDRSTGARLIRSRSGKVWLCHNGNGTVSDADLPGCYLETMVADLHGVCFEMKVVENAECAMAGLRFPYLAIVSERGRLLFAFTSTDLTQSDWSAVRAISAVPCVVGPNGVLIDPDLLRRVKRVVRGKKGH